MLASRRPLGLGVYRYLGLARILYGMLWSSAEQNVLILVSGFVYDYTIVTKRT
jgi:hypothetical protein